MFYLLLVLCCLMTVEGQDKPIMCINGTTLFKVDPECKSSTGIIYFISIFITSIHAISVFWGISSDKPDIILN